jgi:hypothetical protein
MWVWRARRGQSRMGSHSVTAQAEGAGLGCRCCTGSRPLLHSPCHAFLHTKWRDAIVLLATHSSVSGARWFGMVQCRLCTSVSVSCMSVASSEDHPALLLESCVFGHCGVRGNELCASSSCWLLGLHVVLPRLVSRGVSLLCHRHSQSLSAMTVEWPLRLTPPPPFPASHVKDVVGQQLD